jgi:hypothetical protein
MYGITGFSLGAVAIGKTARLQSLDGIRQVGPIEQNVYVLRVAHS